MLHASEKIFQSIATPRKHNKVPGSHGINWEKEVWTGKMKYLPAEQALSQPSSLNKKGNPLNIIGPSRVVTKKSMVIGTRGSFSTPGAQNSNSFPTKSPLQWLLGSARYTNLQNVQNTKIVEQIKNTVQSSKGSGELKSPGVANESPLMNPIMTHLCDPSLAHSWKAFFPIINSIFSTFCIGGSFNIKGAPEFAPGMLNNCIQDYTPSKVRRKVSEIYTALVEFLRNKDPVMRMLINDVELVLITKSLICINTTRAI
ncbi:hypothetical protein P3S67_006031 [Capsicum chacoense]